ncbi:MAG: CDP-alcohol phosphatidyltransferase family protein [Bacteroidales bacterium]|jgi:CDP-diacylglycerol--serine O-phosphatidyltransferase|nr:CDP-alcohol phosphatidyltransferase family protein [Bacteroidales bacterium]
MMSIKKYIPNSITSMNLLCGSLATAMAFAGNLQYAALLIIAGAVFDFFDGFAARLLGVSGEMGKELDSLADCISFGLAPAAMWSTYIKWHLTGTTTGQLFLCGGKAEVALVLLPLILSVFAGLRLAKFNIDTRQTVDFLGLTTTATGLFTASLLWMLDEHEELFRQYLTPYVTLAMLAVFCFLLVSEIPMFSLKIKHWTLSGNELKLILLLVGIGSIVMLGLGGLSVTIALYIVFGVVKCLFSRKKSEE